MSEPDNTALMLTVDAEPVIDEPYTKEVAVEFSPRLP